MQLILRLLPVALQVSHKVASPKSTSCGPGRKVTTAGTAGPPATAPIPLNSPLEPGGPGKIMLNTGFLGASRAGGEEVAMETASGLFTGVLEASKQITKYSGAPNVVPPSLTVMSCV